MSKGPGNGTLESNREAMDRFLEKLRESGDVSLSARAAGISRSTVYDWRRKWKTFEGEWDDAKEEGVDGLEGEAWRRARKHSDRLLMFLLKAYRRDVFGDQVKVDQSVDAKLSIEYINDWRSNVDED